MADYSDNSLLSSIKALEHAVLPALDPTDPLAGEQLRLVMGLLKFFRARMDLVYPRQMFELFHSLDLARQVAGDARLLSDEIAQRLDLAIASGTELKQQPLPRAADVRAASAELAACTSALVRLAAPGDPVVRQRVERAVMQGSKRWVDMQRAWFAPHGFELRPGELPALDQVLFAGGQPPD